ncbi:MAG: hypothetical protein ACKVHU_00210 [Acidimicrobiales bacterium]|jgi:hypothetical protein
MARSESETLIAEIASDHGSAVELWAVFAQLRDRLGNQEASELWWAAFAAQDATET